VLNVAISKHVLWLIVTISNNMLLIYHKENVRFTTPTQQVHNTPSCEGLLCTCCDGVVQESNPLS
jgi:hypothetical protein